MRGKLLAIILIITILIVMTGCSQEPKTGYTKFSNSFFDTFNTLTQVVAYAESEEEFESYYEYIHTRFQKLHKLYDIYNNYEGINNVKTINDNAGVEPVKVDKEIIDLILFAKKWHALTGGQTNIAMGSVLRIWHDYRTEGFDFPEEAKLPPMEMLQSAKKHTDITKVIVDEDASTVYLADKDMSLDVGAIAKGFATQLVVEEMKTAGLTSGIISAGGNISVIGVPYDGVRERWSIGIQNPDESIVSTDGVLETVYVTDASVVSSGDYQRYYVVDGKKYNHIIDAETLMPGEYYRAVSIVAEGSAVADFMSTALFLLPFDESLALANSIEGVDALWVMHDGSVKTTEGLKAMMKSEGATNSLKK
ncbi:MAG: FAD:protein FMN transferase [Firmicutes bacterium]|nr:FAD:protein FMN transferase [Bacillota bacterium]